MFFLFIKKNKKSKLNPLQKIIIKSEISNINQANRVKTLIGCTRNISMLIRATNKYLRRRKKFLKFF